MSRPNPKSIAAFLVVIIAAMGGIALAQGALMIAKHEGDTFHLMQIVLRMADGEMPHLDFMTPIGILSFWPIVLFVNLGFGIGMAIMAAQVLVALVLLAPAVWLAWSRFRNGWGYLFGLVVMVLTLALVHGELDRLVSISMHYNRWAWAVAYLVITAAVLPPVGARADRIDGVIIGVGMALLALAKITYFISFAPGVLLALLLRRAWMTLGFAALAGVVVALAMTAVAGFEFWLAYVSDLRTVSTTDVRPAPGAPLKTVIGAPAYLAGSLALILGVVFLRQAGQTTLGLVLLVLAPGFFFVTFQNSGNDPQWLPLLALLLLAPRIDPEAVNGAGWPLHKAVTYTAIVALALGAGSFLNLAYSPFRHASFNPAQYQPLIPALQQHGDLMGRVARSNRLDATIALDDLHGGFDHLREDAKRDDTATEFMGEKLNHCELRLGLTAWFEEQVKQLDEIGLTAGKPVYVADLFSTYWLFGDIARLPGGTPWYYGGLPGFEAAEYLLVPLCPASPDIRKLILETIDTEAEVTLTEVARTSLFILLSIGRG